MVGSHTIKTYPVLVTVTCVVLELLLFCTVSLREQHDLRTHNWWEVPGPGPDLWQGAEGQLYEGLGLVTVGGHGHPVGLLRRVGPIQGPTRRQRLEVEWRRVDSWQEDLEGVHLGWEMLHSMLLISWMPVYSISLASCSSCCGNKWNYPCS